MEVINKKFFEKLKTIDIGKLGIEEAEQCQLIYKLKNFIVGIDKSFYSKNGIDFDIVVSACLKQEAFLELAYLCQFQDNISYLFVANGVIKFKHIKDVRVYTLIFPFINCQKSKMSVIRLIAKKDKAKLVDVFGFANEEGQDYIIEKYLKDYDNVDVACLMGLFQLHCNQNQRSKIYDVFLQYKLIVPLGSCFAYLRPSKKVQVFSALLGDKWYVEVLCRIFGFCSTSEKTQIIQTLEKWIVDYHFNSTEQNHKLLQPKFLQYKPTVIFEQIWSFTHELQRHRINKFLLKYDFVDKATINKSKKTFIQE